MRLSHDNEADRSVVVVTVVFRSNPHFVFFVGRAKYARRTEMFELDEPNRSKSSRSLLPIHTLTHA